jgi:hypothetical protein
MWNRGLKVFPTESSFHDLANESAKSTSNYDTNLVEITYRENTELILSRIKVNRWPGTVLYTEMNLFTPQMVTTVTYYHDC